MDLLEMEPIAGVELLQGDFRDDVDLARLEALLGGEPVDLVLSDMAPNVSGMKAVDQPRMMYLVELAAELAERILKPGGGLAVKAFQGEGFDAIVKRLRSDYERVAIRKPASSRDTSKEVYLVAKGRRVG
jgi:23S rRNA (uridine2552-2'-O)-methyltransferase